MPGKEEQKLNEMWVVGSLTLGHMLPPSNLLVPVIQICDMAKFLFLS